MTETVIFEEWARVAIVVRVSTRKQAIQGDQKIQFDRCKALVDKHGAKIIKVFYITETARKTEREQLDEIINFCLDKINRINYLVFLDISRLTRLGADEYFKIKRKLELAGVKIRDAFGKIQDTRNIFEDLGFEYEFTLESPTERQEMVEANEVKYESKKALQRMIRAEIEYVNLGFWSGRPPYGFRNIKIDTEHGERTVLGLYEPEAVHMRKMYSMRIQGNDDKQIVKELNSMGFRTRVFKKRNRKNPKKIIGYGGGNELTVKQMQRMIRNTAYCGVICERWTHYKPVKAMFKGLITIDEFNVANRGKSVLKEENGKIKLLKNQKPQLRFFNNPLYPFKCLRCPFCGKPLLGSASRSKSGRHIPRYHCARNHKYWSVNKKELESNVYDFIRRLNFTDDYFKLFKEIVLDVWRQKQKETVDESLTYGQRVNSLRAEKKLLIDKIKSIDSKDVIEELAKDVERANTELGVAEEKRNVRESKEHDIDLLLTYTEYFVEHLEELLINRNNPAQQTALFEFLFEEMPSYQKLVSGTPDLSLVFKLNQQSALSKSQMVDQMSLEWNTLVDYLVKLYNTLKRFVDIPNVKPAYLNARA